MIIPATPSNPQQPIHSLREFHAPMRSQPISLGFRWVGLFGMDGHWVFAPWLLGKPGDQKNRGPHAKLRHEVGQEDTQGGKEVVQPHGIFPWG